jgi:hypothetical protein
MCFTCTLEAVSGLAREDLEDGFTDEIIDSLPWPVVTPEMELLARLRWVLYECTTATTGGPMHIFTDDYNVEDSNVEACARGIEENEPYDESREDWPFVQALSRRMVELARPMTEAERAVALSLSWGEMRVTETGTLVMNR